MLTDTAIRNAPAKPPKPTKLKDEKGLFLLLKPNGSRLWQFRYWFRGKERLLSLGAYPLVSLREARDLHFEARRKLQRGVDPMEERQHEKRQATETDANTFRKLALEWLDNIRPTWSPVHYNDSLKRFQTYVFPKIGKRPINAITVPELLAVLRPVEASGHIITAHKIAGACRQTFRFAIASGRCTHNPAADLRGVLKPRPKAKHHPALLDDADLAKLFRDIDGYPDTHFRGEEQTKLALQLVCLTFVRRNALRLARWDEVDLKGRVWIVPPEPERLKRRTTDDDPSPLLVPLSRQAVAIFRRLALINGVDDMEAARQEKRFVFPSVRSRYRVMSDETMRGALERMGYGDLHTVHGFRTTATSILNETKLFSADAIERQMAHRDKDIVRGVYNRALFWDERVRLVQFWSDCVDHLQKHGKRPRVQRKAATWPVPLDMSAPDLRRLLRSIKDRLDDAA